MKIKPANISQEDWDAVDSPPLTNKQMGDMKPINEYPELQFLLKRGRPPLESPKKAVNIRLAADVLDAFKSTGKGWQTRINDALREWLKQHNHA